MLKIIEPAVKKKKSFAMIAHAEYSFGKMIL